MNPQDRTHELHTNYITRVFDDSCGVDDRTPAEVEQSIEARLDRIEANDGATLPDSNDLAWHFDDERGHIYDSEGRFVIQCKDVRRFDFWQRVCRDHNVAISAGALVSAIDADNTYAALSPREYQLFRDALAAMG